MAADVIPVPDSGLAFTDLYTAEGLARVDDLFLRHLAHRDAGLAQQLLSARNGADALTVKQESELLLALVPCLEAFVGGLFGIEEELQALSRAHHVRTP
ncbi:MAG TPA: hypothetical protein VJ834_15875, partial [Burkholderiales bacterium]|nr:hypothetical protein [Burkholderiales bacterium]